MAKDKKKKKAKAALPKRIAGVKVPKAVRRSRFGDLLASRTGQALIAEALLGAGVLAAGKKASENPKVREATHDAKVRTLKAGDEAAHDVGAAGATLAYALGEAARSFAEALRHGEPSAGGGARALDDGEEPAWAPDYGAPEAEATGGKRKAAKKKQPPAQEAGPL